MSDDNWPEQEAFGLWKQPNANPDSPELMGPGSLVINDSSIRDIADFAQFFMIYIEREFYHKYDHLSGNDSSYIDNLSNSGKKYEAAQVAFDLNALNKVESIISTAFELDTHDPMANRFRTLVKQRQIYQKWSKIENDAEFKEKAGVNREQAFLQSSSVATDEDWKATPGMQVAGYECMARGCGSDPTGLKKLVLNCLKSIDEIMAQTPECVPPVMNCFLAELRNGVTHDKDAIVASLKKAGLDESGYLFNSRMGDIERSFGDYKKSNEYLLKAHGLVKNDYIVRCRLISNYMRLKEWSKAEGLIKEMVADAKKVGTDKWNQVRRYPGDHKSRDWHDALTTKGNWDFYGLFLQWFIAFMQRDDGKANSVMGQIYGIRKALGMPDVVPHIGQGKSPDDAEGVLSEHKFHRWPMGGCALVYFHQHFVLRDRLTSEDVALIDAIYSEMIKVDIINQTQVYEHEILCAIIANSMISASVTNSPGQMPFNSMLSNLANAFKMRFSPNSEKMTCVSFAKGMAWLSQCLDPQGVSGSISNIEEAIDIKGELRDSFMNHLLMTLAIVGFTNPAMASEQSRLYKQMTGQAGKIGMKLDFPSLSEGALLLSANASRFGMNFDQAQTVLVKSLLSKNRYNVNALLAYADLCVYEGKWKHALPLFQEILRIDPKQASESWLFTVKYSITLYFNGFLNCTRIYLTKFMDQFILAINREDDEDTPLKEIKKASDKREVKWWKVFKGKAEDLGEESNPAVDILECRDYGKAIYGLACLHLGYFRGTHNVYCKVPKADKQASFVQCQLWALYFLVNKEFNEIGKYSKKMKSLQPEHPLGYALEAMAAATKSKKSKLSDVEKWVEHMKQKDDHFESCESSLMDAYTAYVIAGAAMSYIGGDPADLYAKADEIKENAKGSQVAETLLTHFIRCLFKDSGGKKVAKGLTAIQTAMSAPPSKWYGSKEGQDKVLGVLNGKGVSVDPSFWEEKMAEFGQVCPPQFECDFEPILSAVTNEEKPFTFKESYPSVMTDVPPIHLTKIGAEMGAEKIAKAPSVAQSVTGKFTFVRKESSDTAKPKPIPPPAAQDPVPSSDPPPPSSSPGNGDDDDEKKYPDDEKIEPSRPPMEDPRQMMANSPSPSMSAAAAVSSVASSSPQPRRKAPMMGSSVPDSLEMSEVSKPTVSPLSSANASDVDTFVRTQEMAIRRLRKTSLNNVRSWGVHDVCRFVKCLCFYGFNEYYAFCMQKNQVDGNKFLNATSESLGQWGVDHIAHRARILSEIYRFKQRK